MRKKIVAVISSMALFGASMPVSSKANSHSTIDAHKHNDNVTTEPKECRFVINSLVKEVQKTSGNLGVKRFNVRRNSSRIWSNIPLGDMFDLDIGGNQKISWYRNTVKMQDFAAKVVRKCPGIIGIVVSTEGDYLYAYGLVSGQTKKFTCPINLNKQPYRWGHYSGGCR